MADTKVMQYSYVLKAHFLSFVLSVSRFQRQNVDPQTPMNPLSGSIAVGMLTSVLLRLTAQTSLCPEMAPTGFTCRLPTHVPRKWWRPRMWTAWKLLFLYLKWPTKRTRLYCNVMTKWTWIRYFGNPYTRPQHLISNSMTGSKLKQLTLNSWYYLSAQHFLGQILLADIVPQIVKASLSTFTTHLDCKNEPFAYPTVKAF